MEDWFYLPSLSQNYLSQIRQNSNPEKFGIQIELPGLQEKKILLLRNHFTNGQLEIFTPSQNFIYPSAKLEKYYHGIVSGEKNSLVALNLGDSLATGIVSMDLDQYVFEHMKSESFDGTVLYRESDIPVPKHFECATDDNALTKPGNFPELLSGANTSSCKVVRMYLECSYQMYFDHGSNIDETMDYILGIFNIASTMYRNEGINLMLSQVFIWTNPDIYMNQKTSGGMISAFNERLWHLKFHHFPFRADVFEFITSASGNGGNTQQFAGLENKNALPV
jgi:hypothetical protein